MINPAFAGTSVSTFPKVFRRPRTCSPLPPCRNSVFCAIRGRPPNARSKKAFQGARKSAKSAQTGTSPPRVANVDLGSEERLQKVMSRLGIASRRQSESMIESGRVRVNGRRVKEQGMVVNPRKDRIVVDGQPLIVNQTPVWVAVHKPRGYLSLPKEGYKWTVESLVPRARERKLTSVGGIEGDYSGLVIMTNERGCVPELASSQNPHVREWIVDCDGIVANGVIAPLRTGVHLPRDTSGIRTSPASLTILGSGKVELSRGEFRTLTRIEVRVRESRHHLVQRLFESVGTEVVRASRRRFGPILLGSLKRGDFRYLTSNEIKALKRGIKHNGR